MDRIAWLREKGKVESIQRELHSPTTTLSLALVVSTSNTAQRVELAVVDFVTDLLFSHHTQRRFAATTHEDLSCLDHRDELLRVQHQELLSILRPQPAVSSKSTTSAQCRLENCSRKKLDNGEFPTSTEEYSQFASGCTRTRTALLPKTESCSTFCRCSCHLTQWLESPKSLRSVLGLAFLGYNGLPTRFHPCNVRSCRRHKRKFSAQFTWYFPPWFVHLALVAFFNMSPASGPEFLLRVPCVVQPTSLIFEYVQSGNLQGIKNLYTDGLASPYDVCGVQGYTLLHVSKRLETLF